ncbi:hypothetical protein CEUSTIGMA_g4804.t1 [Chlamydomonas eustigma]|uniref:ABC transporter domain-containing protein n=1 Tax=Chlamydomonas eustigma TaxID=1157962 RepID=A0A250X2R1_9CHLO|nr:hypothetical protein CEUSTIGMA_g4804.t1 [Chlamydomonas eustigma]|eukprot:GAX77358.1 hypothetical protein CEUSTIGMA_g4804.t1 [Chlamydomonas eustigma]
MGSVLIGLLLCTFAVIVFSQCKFRLDVNETMSTYELSGANILSPVAGGFPISASLEPIPGNFSYMFSGAFFAFPPGTECPTSTQTNWADGLPSWGLNTNASAFSYTPFLINPSQINATTAGQPYVLNNYQLELKAISVSVDASTGAASIHGTVYVAHAMLYSNTVITGVRYDDVASNTSGVFDSTGTLTVQSNGMVYLDLTSFNISLSSVSTLNLGGTDYNAITNVSFLGSLWLSVDTSCNVYCGDFGRCIRAGDGTPGCQCECGWEADSTGACMIPTGYCPVFGGLPESTVNVGNKSSLVPSVNNCNGATFTNPALNEGNANVYRPIIAFIPIMLQVLLLCFFLAAMLLARSWVYSSSSTRGQALNSAHLRSSNYLVVGGGGVTGGPVAEGYHQEPSSTLTGGPVAEGYHQEPSSTLTGGPVAEGYHQEPSSTMTGGPVAEGYHQEPPPTMTGGPVAEGYHQEPPPTMTGGPVAEGYHQEPSSTMTPSITSASSSSSAMQERSSLQARPSSNLVGNGYQLAAHQHNSIQMTSTHHPQRSGIAVDAGRQGLLQSGDQAVQVALHLPGVPGEGVDKLVGAAGDSAAFGPYSNKNVNTSVRMLRFQDIAVEVYPSALSALTARLFSRIPCSSSSSILSSLSGCCHEGHLLGLLGPSGSGKSTLLNVLSGQIQDGGRWKVQGNLTLHGYPAAAGQLSSICAFVPQHDMLLPSLTVEECLLCSAALRMSSSATVSQAKDRVATVMKELKIEHLRGLTSSSSGSTREISGGERRRVSIGMELVTDTRLLILDEPTSGLDSFNALSLVNLLSALARGSDGKAPRIVIASLHQPSPSMFVILDQVILLANGQLIYSGSPESAPAAFLSLGIPCPAGLSIAEHMLVAVGDPAQAHLLHGSNMAQNLRLKLCEPGSMLVGHGAWTKQQSGAASVETPLGSTPCDGYVHVQGKRGMDGERQGLTFTSMLHMALLRQPGVLMWSSMAGLFRSPAFFLMHIAGGMAMGLLVGFVFFNISVETTDGVIGRLGTLFFAVNVVSFPALSALESVLSEQQVVERELCRGYYSPLTYILIKLVVDGFLLRVTSTAVFGVLFYWIVGFRANATAFTIFLGVLLTLSSLIGALVLSLTSLLGSSGRTIITTTTMLLIFALFSGFLANMENMTWVLRWICYVSPFRWSWMSLVINEVRPLNLTLSVATLPPVHNYPGGELLLTLGTDPTQLTTNIIALVCEYVGVFLLAVLALYARIWLIKRGWVSLA